MLLRNRNLGALIVDDIRDRFFMELIDQTHKVEWLLDLGCSIKPHFEKYNKICKHSVGLDVPFSNHAKSVVDVFGLGNTLPFKSEAFDLVFCSEVMNHTPEPAQFLVEIRRVLKPEGKLIMTTPFMVALHEAPYDFFRYTSYGLEYLIDKSGLELLVFESFGGLHAVMIQFIVKPQLKLWNIIAKFTGISWLYGILNPFVFFLVYLPQVLYVTILRLGCRVSLFERVHKKLSYATIGYGILAKKNLGLQNEK